MKRRLEDKPSLNEWELLRIHEILAQLNIRDISWLEALATVNAGALLAKILYKLEKPNLLLMCRASKTIYDVCQRYQMIERFYTDSVYMFGSGVYGRLGDGVSHYRHTVEFPVRLEDIPNVAAVSCGFDHTGIVTVAGDVYMFGKLGAGDMNDRVRVPRQIQNIPKVTSLSCGKYHTGIVTVDGDVYMFGKGSRGRLGDGDTRHHRVGIPKRIQNIPTVVSISCGKHHTGVLTTDGEVYMFGRGSFGKLGDGDTGDHSVAVPRQIQGIPKIATISCGNQHTGIVTIDGDVYMFGRLGDTNIVVAIPTQIQGIPKVVTVSCGKRHTGVVSVGGDVYMFGNGEYGKLGDGDTRNHNVEMPRKIQNIPKISAISCGYEFTGIVTLSGDVYMFGNGYAGVLADGDTSDHSVGTPTLIEGIPKIARISCGNIHVGLVTIAESSLNLTISCQVCNVRDAQYYSVHREQPAVFCSEQCQREFYYN